MALAVRTLPIHLEPVDGEALDSWLEALCRQMGCTWGDFAEAVGLPPPPRGIRTPSWLIRLTPTEARALHAATGTPIQILHSMTLASLDGTGLGLLPATRALDRSFPWSRFRFSRYCPECLQDNGGRWQLFWRSGWAFACVEHCCLLVDECLACGHRLRGHVGHAELVPDGQRCSNASGDTRQVERPNAAAPTWPLPPLCGWDRATPPSPRSTSSGRSSIPALPHSASITTTPRQLSGLWPIFARWPAGSWPRPLLTIGVESCPPTSTPPTLQRSSAAAHPPSVTNPSPGERLRHTQ